MSGRVRAVEAIVDAAIAAAEVAMVDELRGLTDVDRSLLTGAMRDLRAYGDALAVIAWASGSTDLIAPVLSAIRVVGWFTGPKEQGAPLFERGRAATARAAKSRERATVDAAIAAVVGAHAGEKRRPKLAAIVFAVNARLGNAGLNAVSDRAVRRRLSAMGLTDAGRGRPANKNVATLTERPNRKVGGRSQRA